MTFVTGKKQRYASIEIHRIYNGSALAIAIAALLFVTDERKAAAVRLGLVFPLGPLLQFAPCWLNKAWAAAAAWTICSRDSVSVDTGGRPLTLSALHLLHLRLHEEAGDPADRVSPNASNDNEVH